MSSTYAPANERVPRPAAKSADSTGIASESASGTKHQPTDSGYGQTYSPTPTPGQEIPGAFPLSVEPTPVNEKPQEPLQTQKDALPAPQSSSTSNDYFPNRNIDTSATLQPTAMENASIGGTDAFVNSNRLRPDMPDDNASTASIKSGIVGREPKSMLTDFDTSSIQPAIGATDVPESVDRKESLSSDTGHANSSSTYTVRSFPLQTSHRSDQESNQPYNTPLSSFAGREMASHEQRTNPTLQNDNTYPADKSQQEHHYGRNTAVAGVGAIGAASAYGLMHDKKDDSGPASRTVGPHESNVANVVDPRVLPQPEKQKSNVVKHPETGPATHTVGPHDSNVTNIVDPRVLPQPEKQKSNVVKHPETGPATSTVGPHDSNLANIADPRVLPQPEKQIGSDVKHPETGPATKTIGPHKSNIANILDPRVLPEPEKMKGHGEKDTETGPASHTIGPHKSNIVNIVDPTVLPDPAKQKEHKTTGPHQSDMLNRIDPKARPTYQEPESVSHHHGRDAAVVGGAAIAGAGATAAWKQHEGHGEPTTQSSHGAFNEHPVRPSVGPSEYSADDLPQPGRMNHYEMKMAEQRAEPTSATHVGRAINPETLQHSGAPTHHDHGKDAAIIGGAGTVGAAGATAYSHKDHHAKHNDQVRSSPLAQPQPYPTAHATRQEGDETHTARNATVGVGATSAGAAAYEHHKHEAEKAEAQMGDREQAANDKRAKQLQKDHQKEERQHEKELRKEEKHHEKDLKKEEKHHEKEHEKKGGLLGFLHKDKDRSVEPEDERRKDKDLALGASAAGVGAGAGAAAYEHERLDYQKREPQSPTSSTGSTGKDSPRRRSGVLGSIFHRKDKSHRASDELTREEHGFEGDSSHGDAHTGHSGKHGRNRLHKDPPRDYIEKFQQQHGTSQSPEHHQIEHSPADSNNSLNDSGRREYRGADQGISSPIDSQNTTEQPSGFPTGIGQYGDGVGGINSNPAVHGYPGQVGREPQRF